MLEVKIKKLGEKAVTPSYAKYGDAAMDLTATSKSYDEHGNVVYGTGIAFEIPEGYVGLLFPRSSNCKKDLLLANSVGVVDSGYRGEVMLKFKPSPYIAASRTYEDPLFYEVGERIGQIMIIPIPQVKFVEVEELTNTERGVGGFGSSGK